MRTRYHRREGLPSRSEHTAAGESQPRGIGAVPSKRGSLLLSAAIAILLGLWSCTNVARPADTGSGMELHYRIRPDLSEGIVAVRLALSGLDSSIDRLRFSFSRGHTFLELDAPLIDGEVRAFGAEGALGIERVDPFTWEVTPSGESGLRLEYVVPIRHRSLDAVRESHDAYEFPYLDENHGMLTTWTLFATPRLGRSSRFAEPARISVTIDGCAEDAIVPWPRIGQATFQPPSMRTLTHDLIAVGKWSRHAIEVGDFRGIVAVAPGQRLLEQKVVDPIARIVAAELELFGRTPRGRYVFLFGRPDTRGTGGSPKANSMTLTVDPRTVSAGVDSLPHLVAHEFHHTWTAALFESPDELRWYSEGFTDYFAYLVIARLGMTTWEDFTSTLGVKMSECASNTHRGKLSLVKAGGKIFFTDRDAYQLVYGGGLLTAAWLDCAIRAEGKGKRLDDFMRTLNNDDRWDRGRLGPTVDDFVAVARTYIGPEKADELEAMVREPFAMRPTRAFGPFGVEIARFVEAPDMSLRANLDGVRVIDLDRSGVAWRAGLRQDDRFVTIDGQAVTDQIGVRKAWLNMADGRIRFSVDRGGSRIVVDEPMPRVEAYDVPVEPWQD